MVGSAGTKHLAEKMPQMQSLTSLAISTKYLQVLLFFLTYPLLGNNTIGEDGATALAKSILKLPLLKEIYLGEYLAINMSKIMLIFFNVGDNRIGKVGSMEFAEGLISRNMLDMPILHIHGLNLCTYTTDLRLGDEFKDCSDDKIITYLTERKKSVF